jgi:hypothetical protein
MEGLIQIGPGLVAMVSCDGYYTTWPASSVVRGSRKDFLPLQIRVVMNCLEWTIYQKEIDHSLHIHNVVKYGILMIKRLKNSPTRGVET